eukprot:TRINITY_DN19248_c0_g1_i1.p2 TRINITY_DN19248_c0_g1~~TRINITY_DN19248_c0_g1_i1.p2  ORF type:complete len:262 (+),score=31.41 TRINITY_DN19248_c0_g1_i1:595-1380(+)
MEMQFKKFDEKKMQELLPDYIFDRLNNQDKLDFEYNLPQYPEVQNEVDEVRQVFNRFEKMDFDKIVSEKTRNMSIKVNKRLSKRYERTQSKFNVISRFALPLAAVGVISVFMIINSKNHKPLTDIKTSQMEIISKKIDNIADSLSSIASIDIQSNIPAVVETSTNGIISKTDSENTSIINNLVADELIKDKKSVDKFLGKQNVNGSDFMDDLENMDESQFQVLMEDLKNVELQFQNQIINLYIVVFIFKHCNCGTTGRTCT